MAIAAGTRFGSYEVVSALGAGGMGEVYRARDAKLNRDVAIKVLPTSFANDPDRLARFQREAQVLASLNHPNVGAIYGFEESEDLQALVLELVEGPTLADRIAEGPIPLAEAVSIARQIADALETAHEQGIVHRDLKPANIKLRPDGTVKVLDFGLAKAMEPAGAASSMSLSPTITSPAMTQAGVILGTAAYMSPEQAAGKTADKRSDLWAFGVVLLEMLTGRPVFTGETVAHVLASVLKSEPDWTTVPAETPPPIRRLLRRCLTKDRKRRLDSAADARLEIDEALTTPASESAMPAVDSRIGWRRGAMIAAAALVVGAAAAAGSVWMATRPGPAQVMRTTIETSGDAALVNNGNTNLAITPDGSRIVYQGVGQLLVRRLEQLEPTTLVDSGRDRSRATLVGSLTAPFVSPDGQWVGFFDGPVLKKVAITGGPPVTLAQNTVTGSGGPLGATWNAQGTIVFATSSTRGLRRVSAAGGDVETLTTPDQADNETRHIWPDFLPDGQTLIFTIARGSLGTGGFDIGLLDLATGTQSVLIRGGNHARYVPTGHLVYGAGGTLSAVAFDLERRAVVGMPVPVLESAASARGVGAYEFDIAANGTLAYVMTDASAVAAGTLVWVDRKGHETPLGAPARPYLHPRLAPDGTRLAIFSADREVRNLWMWDFRRATLTRAVLDEASGTIPLWTPDSQRLVFSSPRAGSQNLYMRPTDGTGTTVRLTESSNSQHPTGVTPDGTQVVFYEATPANQRDIQLLTLTSTPKVTPLVTTRFDEGGGVVSPDGRWLAYESNSTGSYEVYVRPFPAVDGGLWPISTTGGMQPLWARNGRELFYVAPDGALMAVAVEAKGSAWSAAAPVQLFARPYFRGNESGISSRQYDVSADGQRFLMMKEQVSGIERAPSIIVVQNWFEELKRLVPIK